ncbi:unnamed protein product [Bursaphelenchus xylophilus]|uniref:(pine wood nematode) hypothetical protein n=1 Tax=Bursaphelenchus xylophilus TaxID=6326 RepID=A0A1I7S5G2_BURXY|nr:unnamed protein product [Bursaphelenchus xylophilus]CAG9118043.1 unnamed protein product [Bursaphelenchus xylophilus]
MYESARLGRLVNAGIGGKAAEYFYSVYQNIEKAGMNEEVARLRSQFPDYEVWVTGHSLGAALASVSAGELVKLKGVPSAKLKLITFGEPRTGNAQYARNFEKLVPYAFRVVNRKDTVPHMPPQNFLGYTHHSAEVWYENGMTDGGFKICPTPEDKACSNRVVVGYNWQDHIRYYTKMILGYGIAGCGDFGDVIKRFWG